MRISKFTLFASFMLALICISPPSEILSDEFKKPKKATRIQDAAFQEWLFTNNPLTKEVDRSSLHTIYSSISKDGKRSSSSLYWNNIGPRDVAGRIREIHQDPSTKKIFIGSATGGLWTCNDIGDPNMVWSQVNDQFASLSVCAIEQDVSNPSTLFFGTGEGYFDHEAFPGAGMYTSTDSGQSWGLMSSTTNKKFKYIQDIITTKNGNLIVTTLNNGVQLSTNDGATWTEVIGTTKGNGVNSANRLVKMNDGTLFVSTGLHETGDIYRSTNNGVTWTPLKISNHESKFHRIEIASNATNSNIIYAILQHGETNGVKSVLKSSNKGTTWTKVNLPSIGKDIAGNQAWYNLAISVSPENPNHLIIGGVDLFISKNGGLAWTQISNWSGSGVIPYIHGDQHKIEFINDTDALVANDGGVTLMTDVFSNDRKFFKKNRGLNVTQCYDVVANPINGQITTGTQDNGTHRFLDPTSDETIEITGGDGGRCYYDEENPDIQITSYIKNQYYVSNDGGDNFYFRSFNNDGLFINPTTYDSGRKILYAADEKGKILRWNNPSDLGTHADKVVINNLYNQQITSLKSSKIKDNRLYLGSSEGEVHRLEFAFIGTNRTGIKILDLPDGHVIGDIEEDPYDENRLVVSVSNYGVKSVYITEDGGKNWDSIEGNLPDVPVRDVLLLAHENDAIYIATEIGVFKTTKIDGNKTDWVLLNEGMANIRVDRIAYNPQGESILAASFGRGIYEGKLNDDVSIDFDYEGVLAIYEDERNKGNNGCDNIYSFPVVIKANRPVDGDVKINLSIENDGIISSDLVLGDAMVTMKHGSLKAMAELLISDDKQVEDVEGAILKMSYTMNGQEVKRSLSLSLTSDDNYAEFTEGEDKVLIGTSDMTSFEFPFKGYYEDAKSQFIIRASELKTAGLSEGIISGLEFHIENKVSSKPFMKFTIGLKNTAANEASASGEYLDNESIEEVYTNDYNTIKGWNSIRFDQGFYWDGESNLLVQMCYNNSKWSSNDEVSMVSTNYPSSQYDHKDSNKGCNLDRIRSNAKFRPVFSFTKSGSSIEICDSKYEGSSSIYKGDCVFKNDEGHLVANVESLTLQSACVHVEIESAGYAFGESNWSNIMSVSDKHYFYSQNDYTKHLLKMYFSADEIKDLNVDSKFFMVKSNGSINHATNPQLVASDNLDWQKLPGGGIEIETVVTGDTGIALAQYKSNNHSEDMVEKRKIVNDYDADIFPNPFMSQITIRLHNQVKVDTKVLIVDQNGKTIKSSMILTNSDRVSFGIEENIPAGIYYVHVIYSDGMKLIKQVIKVN